MKTNYIDVNIIEEHEDGSATFEFDIPKDAQPYFISLGIKLVLYCEANGINTDEAFKLILDTYRKDE